MHSKGIPCNRTIRFYAFFMNSDTFVTEVGSRLSVIQTNALERRHFNHLQDRPDAVYLDESGRMVLVQRYEVARQVKMRLSSGEQASMRRSPARAGGRASYGVNRNAIRAIRHDDGRWNATRDLSLC